MCQDPNCIFCKIAAGEIPSNKIYEDDDVVAFKDIHPQAPVHFLIVPKRHITSLATAEPGDDALLGKMLGLTRRLALEQGCENGFRVIINTGRDVTDRFDITVNGTKVTAKAHSDIRQERRKVFNEMKTEISDIAIEIAEKVTEKEIDSDKHRELIDSFIDQIGEAS